MAEFILQAILYQCFRGVPVLFHRSLPDKLKLARLVGLLSLVLGVLSWTAARMISQNNQNTIAELAFGIAGWILFLLFFFAAWWCGASVERQ